jgi:PilZ domain
MSERRRSVRKRSFLGGQIMFDKGRVRQECIVRNLSAHGAWLVFDHPVTVPNRFDLHIPQRKRSFRAKVAWCRADEVGVSLVPVDPSEA